MAISRISSATNNGDTVTIGTHAAGDLLLMFSYRDGSITQPTIPSGWISLYGLAVYSMSVRVSYKFATTGSETSGTWTNATSLLSTVYRGGTNALVFPWYILQNSSASSTTINWPTQDGGLVRANITDEWKFALAAQRNSSNSVETAPTLLTNVTSATDSSSWKIAWHDSNSNLAARWTSTNVTVTNAAAYIALMFSLAEVTYPAASSSAFRPVNIRGGADQ